MVILPESSCVPYGWIIPPSFLVSMLKASLSVSLAHSDKTLNPKHLIDVFGPQHLKAGCHSGDLYQAMNLAISPNIVGTQCRPKNNMVLIMGTPPKWYP